MVVSIEIGAESKLVKGIPAQDASTLLAFGSSCFIWVMGTSIVMTAHIATGSTATAKQHQCRYSQYGSFLQV